MKISLVVPFLNEKKGIQDVLAGITDQTEKPQEIVFVDAGSKDQTDSLIQAWGKLHPEVSSVIISCPGAYPGAARVRGIEHATHEWIAFLDAGVRPDSLWLANLKSKVGPHIRGAWGSCQTEATGAVATMVAAYSMGQGSVTSYVLPASLFHREVFQALPPMRGELRAGEDTIWRESYFTRYGQPAPVSEAVVYYHHFPQTIQAAYRKWFTYAKSMAIGGVAVRQQLAYVLFFALLLSLVLTTPAGGELLFIVYLFLRGVVDPIRRSRHSPWFGKNYQLALVGPLYVLGSDLSKACGFLAGWIARLK